MSASIPSLERVVSLWNELLGSMHLVAPAYYYSKSLLAQNVDLVRTTFEGLQVAISVKANPNRHLIASVIGRGLPLDIASIGELNLVIEQSRNHAGRPYLTLVGPGKTEALLRRAITHAVDEIIAESVRELTTIARLVAGKGSQLTTLVRVNPTGTVADANEVMGGRPSQFGIDEDSVPEALSGARSAGLDVSGLHYFLGSQIRSTPKLCSNFRTVVDSASRLIDSSGIDLRVICFGGGFGIPHTPADELVSLRDVAAVASAGLKRLTQVVGHAVLGRIEVGRLVFGNAGVFLTEVVEVKQSRGTTYVVVNSGVSGFSRPALSWGEQHPTWKLGDPILFSGEKVTIVGPTCMPGDILGREVFLDRPEEGDILVIGNAGAYGYSASLGRWGSLEEVSEIVI